MCKVWSSPISPTLHQCFRQWCRARWRTHCRHDSQRVHDHADANVPTKINNPRHHGHSQEGICHYLRWTSHLCTCSIIKSDGSDQGFPRVGHNGKNMIFCLNLVSPNWRTSELDPTIHPQQTWQIGNGSSSGCWSSCSMVSRSRNSGSDRWLRWMSLVWWSHAVPTIGSQTLWKQYKHFVTAQHRHRLCSWSRTMQRNSVFMLELHPLHQAMRSIPRWSHNKVIVRKLMAKSHLLSAKGQPQWMILKSMVSPSKLTNLSLQLLSSWKKLQLLMLRLDRVREARMKPLQTSQTSELQQPFFDDADSSSNGCNIWPWG